MESSLTFANLAAALSKAQGEMAAAPKNRANPMFKSAYADLASVWAACRAALSKYELTVLQPVASHDDMVTVTTLLVHSSGEWISEKLSLRPVDMGPQAVGSVTSYARRYGLAAMVGVVTEDDDDGNAASAPASDPGTFVPSKVSIWTNRIAEARSVEALDELGLEINEQANEEERIKLHALYAVRRKILTRKEAAANK